MTDVFNRRKRSAVMAAIRGSGNKDTELRLLGILRKARVTGWRRNSKLCGKPDFVFGSQRLAVFVDGCFWHGCKKHGRKPASNQSYWIKKLRRNRLRDKEVEKTLRKLGWQVLRIWEHDLRFEKRVAGRIANRLSRNRKP